jgi:hypothetical protein
MVMFAQAFRLQQHKVQSNEVERTQYRFARRRTGMAAGARGMQLQGR